MPNLNVRLGFAARPRWSEATLLATARARTRCLQQDVMVRLQSMLAALVEEAGWSEEELVDALCRSAICTQS